MSKPFKFHSVNNGHCRVNFTAINPQGQRVYYCIMLDEFNKYQLYRSCQKWEPSWKAHPKIPLHSLIDIESLPKDHMQLIEDVREYIINHTVSTN